MPYYPGRKPELPGEEKESQRDMEKRSRLFRLSLFVLSGILVLYAGIRLVIYFSELDASRSNSRELRRVSEQVETETVLPTEPPTSTPSVLVAAAVPPEVKETEPPEEEEDDEEDESILPPVPYPNNPHLTVSDRFRRLRQKSSYIIGWLVMDGVDEPVVLKDNSFFLNHDASGHRNSNGAIFLDDGISLLTRPYLVMLYGHNMKSGNMFGRLKRYREDAYLTKNRIITFDSLYEEGRYAVFSVLEINTVPGTALWYDLWSLDSNVREEREAAIRTLERRSVRSNVLDVQADDQILLLITCLDGDDERLVVAARRLREDETETRLTLKRR